MNLFDFFKNHQVILAPMAGVSDKVFRSLCLEFGAQLTYTEMVSAKGLSYSSERTRALLAPAAGENCVVVQLFGHEPDVLASQAAQVEDLLGDTLAYLDVNMGCPARKITGKGDGAALMKDPGLAKRIVEAMVSAVSKPVTVKFRRGYELGEETAVAFAQMLEAAGAAAFAVHGRFARQMYRGAACWDTIAQVKRAVSVPVIGNGDLRKGIDVLAMREQTNCDAFMIGRAAEGNPWVFSRVAAALSGENPPPEPTLPERVAVAKRHAALLAEEGERGLVRMRKHAMWYLKGFPHASAARSKLAGCVTLNDFERVFDALLGDALPGTGDVLTDPCKPSESCNSPGLCNLFESHNSSNSSNFSKSCNPSASHKKESAHVRSL